LRKIAFFIFLIHFLIQLTTLSHYGFNWDEVRRNYRSQAYLHYFLTGKENYSDLSQPRQSLYQKSPQGLTFSYFASQNIIGHPPIGDLFEAFGNFVFYQQLGIMSDTDSYHLFIIFTSSILVASLFLFTASEYGIFAGFIATLALSLYPLFTGESHFNFKDPLEAVFFALSLLTLYKGIVRNSWKWIVASSVFAGIALGTKFNIFFAGPIAILWLIIYFWGRIKSLKWPFSRQFTISLISYPFVIFGILYAFWPYLWQHPITNLIDTFKYYALWGYGYRFQPDNYFVLGGFNTYPLQWIFFTTPLVTMFLTVFGIIYMLKNGFGEKNKTAIFIFIWLIITLIRVIAPRMGTTNGVRELFEYIPAMAILSGIGAYYIVKLLPRYVSKLNKKWNMKKIKLILQALIILAFIPIAIKLISIHPNENVYFNSLIGGLKGAKEHKLYSWGNDFGNAYRQGANWLNKNVEKNAKVDLAMGGEGNLPRTWLRKDIEFSNELRRNFMQKNGEYVMERTGESPTWPNDCYWVYVRNFLKPVYEIKVDSVAIFTIWKNDGEHTYPEFHSGDKLHVLDGCSPNEGA